MHRVHVGRNEMPFGRDTRVVPSRRGPSAPTRRGDLGLEPQFAAILPNAKLHVPGFVFFITLQILSTPVQLSKLM